MVLTSPFGGGAGCGLALTPRCASGARGEAGSQALEFALVVPLLGLLLALLVQTGLVLADVVVAQGIAREVGRTAAVDGDGPARRLARELAGSRDIRVELVERDGMVTARIELATGAFALVGVDLWLPATATFRAERPVPAALHGR